LLFIKYRLLLCCSMFERLFPCWVTPVYFPLISFPPKNYRRMFLPPPGFSPGDESHFFWSGGLSDRKVFLLPVCRYSLLSALSLFSSSARHVDASVTPSLPLTDFVAAIRALFEPLRVTLLWTSYLPFPIFGRVFPASLPSSSERLFSRNTAAPSLHRSFWPVFPPSLFKAPFSL